MKAITIWQPWASLIMVGAKPYEFRPKSYLRYINAPKVFERIVIHAGARPVKAAEVEDLLVRLNKDESTGLDPVIARAVLERCRAAAKYQALPLGCALGTAVIGQPRNAGLIFKGVRIEDSDRGDFNFAWPLSDIRAFDAPIPMRGAQGFFNVELSEAA